MRFQILLKIRVVKKYFVQNNHTEFDIFCKNPSLVVVITDYAQRNMSRDDLLKLIEEKDIKIQFLTKRLIEVEKKLELEKIDGIRKLAERLAHDLKNPLSVIKNVVEVIETKKSLRIEEKITFYKKLDKAVQRMSHQIEEVLMYVNTKGSEFGDYLVTDLIHLAMVDMMIPEQVKLNVEKSMIMIRCDQKQMIALFANLIMNAIHAIKSSGVVDVKINDEQEWAMISVIDSGPGIPDDIATEIFEPMFTTKQQGTGLGLSICKKIIEQHGGTIGFTNSPTTFSIRLPTNQN